jgi:D-amino-acid dehydrogenase
LLKKGIRAAIPGITWQREEEWMGHRPAPADSIPIIGELDHIRGAFTGFGHHHVGLTGGPKTGQILSGLISGKKSNLNLAPYAPSRFH